MRRFSSFAMLLVGVFAFVALLCACSSKAGEAASTPVLTITVGSGSFWAFVTALAAVTGVLTQAAKKVAVIPPLALSAATSLVVVIAVHLIGWVSLIPPGFSSWAGLWLMVYLSSCGLFDVATLKGLIPSDKSKG